MSQGFKLKFDHIKENDPTKQAESNSASEDAFYPAASNTRNLCLVWLDGRMQFLNYAYLVSGEFDSLADKILLIFTTHKIIIVGKNLFRLFEKLIAHSPRIIQEKDDRYLTLNDPEEYSVSLLSSEAL